MAGVTIDLSGAHIEVDLAREDSSIMMAGG